MTSSTPSTPFWLVVLIVAQTICVAFFLYDVIDDGLTLGKDALQDIHFIIECLAALGLIGAVAVETRYLMALLRRKAFLERQVSVASSAFHDVIDANFIAWGLTPSEADIAHFTVKGCSILEIADLRGSAEGTIKSHLNAIYRKAGVGSRSELLSLLIEDLIGNGLETPTAPNLRAV